MILLSPIFLSKQILSYTEDYNIKTISYNKKIAPAAKLKWLREHKPLNRASPLGLFLDLLNSTSKNPHYKAN